MGKSEQYFPPSFSHLDDPNEYYRRLTTYSPSRPQRYSGSSGSRRNSYNKTEPADPYSLSPPKSYVRPQVPEKNSSARSNGERTELYASPRPRGGRTHSYTPSRPETDLESDQTDLASSSKLTSDLSDLTPNRRPILHSHSRTASSPGTRTQSYAKTQSRITFDTDDDDGGDDDEESYSPTKRYQQQLPSHTRKRSWLPHHRKTLLISLLAALILLILIIVAGVESHKSTFHYTPSTAQVTNEKAFLSGGATFRSPNKTLDGIGAGLDKYTYYSGPAANFPNSSHWISFENMWQANAPNILNSCASLGIQTPNTPAETKDIYNAIQDRANASLVDHRLILAIILQESHGCVRVGSTTSSGGVTNPGLMQSHNGYSFVASAASQSILAMVQDGTQGTEHGDGLVQNLNRYGDPYSAARGYNSGYIPKSGDLSGKAGATACYVTDVANRLTGWVDARSECPGDGESG